MNATPPNQHDQLVKTARVWVAQTFFGEMLKQMHNSPFKTEMTSGGRGGEAFQSQLDQHLAERMARSGAGERLVQSIVRKIEHRTGDTYVASRARS
jgi:Rod binding domain-containing protein